MTNKCKPPLPLRSNPSRRKAVVNPDDPTSIEVLADMCKVFDLYSEQITSKTLHEKYFKYRRLYCYITNVLCSEKSNDISALVNICRGTWLLHAKQCIEFFNCCDSRFMRLWERYVAESELWEKHFNKRKQALIDAAKTPAPLKVKNGWYVSMDGPWDSAEDDIAYALAEKLFEELRPLNEYVVLIKSCHWTTHGYWIETEKRDVSFPDRIIKGGETIHNYKK